MFTEEDKAKFWSLVEIGSKEECWKYKGCVNRNHGYYSYKSKPHMANRFAYLITNGSINQRFIMSTCGNTLCCNPNHLFETNRRSKVKKEEIEFFFSKVKKGTNQDDCWIWTGTKNNLGYGTFYINTERFRAHRYSYKFYHGFIDDSLVILHNCNNPSCVNPLHLTLGTVQENINDTVSKGRHRRKLLPHEIKYIQDNFVRTSAAKSNQIELARMFNVTPENIKSVLKNGRKIMNFVESFSTDMDIERYG